MKVLLYIVYVKMEKEEYIKHKQKQIKQECKSVSHLNFNIKP